MADLNEVRIIGRLTRNPELRSTPSGTYVGNFGVATNRSYKNNSGNEMTETTYIDCACFGRMAETINKYLKKGSQVYIGGRLKYESWEDKETGKKRTRLSVIAENIQFLDRKPGDGNGAPTPVGSPLPNLPPDAGVPQGNKSDEPESWADETAENPPF